MVQPVIFQKSTSPEKPDKTFSITSNIAIWTVAIAFGVACLVISVSFYNISKKAGIELEEKAEEYMTFLSNSLEAPLWNFETEITRSISTLTVKNDMIIALEISDVNEVLFRIEKDRKGRSIELAREVLRNGAVTGRIHLALSSHQIDKKNRQLLLTSVSTVLLSLFLLIFVINLLTRKFLRVPLGHLTKLADAYARGEYDIRQTEDPCKEFQPFADVLEKMGSTIKIQVNELKEAEEKYRSIFENATEGVFQATGDGVFLNANPVMAGILGYDSPNELIDTVTNIKEQLYVNPEKRDEYLEQLRKEKSVTGFEAELYRKDGTKIWTNYYARGIFDGSGKLLFTEGTLGDITLRKKSEAELQRYKIQLEELVQLRTIELSESEAKLKAITNAAKDAIIMMNERGEIAFWNQSAEKMFGYTEGGALGRYVHEFLAPRKYLEAFHQKFPGFLKTGAGGAIGKTSELPAVRKDGSEFIIELSLDSVKIAGQWNAVGILRDITDRKLAEAKLNKAKEAAEVASRAKSEFLANLSHEIRTPLNAIIGMADLLKETTLSKEQRQFVHIYESNSEALLELINNIIDLSKIETGKFALEKVGFNLRDLIEKTCMMMALTAHEKRLEFLSDLDSNVPECLKGDPVRLRQILVNLIGNAVKFTAEGEMIVKCGMNRADRFDSESEEDIELLFTISDTGVGIPAEKLETIFESFTQADSSTTREYGGTGLGLTISKQLVELMNGTIWAESVEGRGSTFYFTARFESAVDQEELSPPAPKFLRAMRFLIIDDNATNRMIIRKFLQSWGSSVNDASDGEVGITALKAAAANSLPYDMVILDCRMPGMDGFSVAKRIKEDPALQSNIIIMLSSDERRLNPERYRRQGISTYLVKPVRKFELLSAICAYSREGMPVKDGYSATRELREFEKENGLHPAPVIALTAYALHGDMAKCLAAGCTAHLGKPLKKARLLEIIYKYLSGAQPDVPEHRNCRRML